MNEKVDIQPTITLGFDVLHILVNRFRKPMGRQFDNIWEKCLEGLDDFSKAIFQDIKPHKENLDINTVIVKTRYERFEGRKDAKMVMDAFLQLIGLLTDAVKKSLGEPPVREAFQEAVKLISVVGKYQEDTAVVEHMLEGFNALA